MRKYLKGKYWKRRFALLLAVSMVLTANVFSIDAMSVYAAETEDEVVQNDNSTAFEEVEESEGINEDSASLSENEDESSPAEDEDQLQDADDVEEPLAEVSENGEGIGKPAYRVLKLDDVDSFNEVKNDKDLLKGKTWNETENLDTYLADDGMEYVVIRATQASESKKLELPANIKGAMLVRVPGMDEEAEWQLNELNIKGAETSVYLYNLVINTDGSKFTIDFSAAEENNSKVVLEGNVVNAQIYCASTAGTIGFIWDNIIKGYSVKCKTRFEKTDELEFVDLLINGEAGLSFEEITSDANTSIVFNGYPENTESLPRFNKKIELGEGTGEDNGSIGLNFWQRKDNPFWLDESIGDDWWEAEPAVTLEKGTQIAYFAGITRAEQELIGCNVHYYSHDNEDGTNNNEGLYLNSATGRLEMDGVPEERAAFAVIELNDAEEFNKVKVNTDLIFGENNAYENRWDETDTLAEYLESKEYVVIQATKTSHELEDKTLELPDNIKGALLVHDWDNEAGTGLEWQLNTLKVKAGTEVYMNDISINTMGQDFNIELEDNTAKVVFGGQCIVNAIVKCESESGTIEFIGDNIVNGYITTAKTRFTAPEPSEGEGKAESASLLIRDAAGLSFESITGDVEVSLIFNGYPENEDCLPYFNKEIDLGEVDDEEAEGGKRDRVVTINFWERMNEPFWLDSSVEDWWGAVPAEDLGVGTLAAYFAGTTRKEKESISFRVGYWNHSKSDEEDDLFIAYTGRLEIVDGEIENCSYRILKLDEGAFKAVKENPENVYEKSYDEQWDETDMLSEYLKSGDLEYVVIQATESSYELNDKTLKLPENIKGVLLLSEHYEEDYVAAWQLNTIKAEGSKEIHIFDAGIDPMSHEAEDSDAIPEEQGLKIETTAADADVNIVIVNSEIMGDLSLSGIADIKFIDSKVFGATDLGSNKPTVSLEGQIVADNLSGYSALEINGDTTFIVRYHGEVVIENCSFNNTNENPEEGQSLLIVYNGYPEDTSLLPVFGDNIVFPDKCGIILRFVKQSDEYFWEGDWWEKTPDENLLLGSQIATVNIDGNKFDSLMEKFNCHNADNIENAELVRDENGALRIQKHSESGKRVVDFVLPAGNTKTYDGTVFMVNESDVTNNCGYTGNVELAWMTKAGTELEQAPKDAGEYKLKMSVPADTQDFEGETQVDITIRPKTVTVSVKPNENKAEGYEIIWTGFVGDETYTTQAEVVTGDGGKYRMVNTKGGDAGDNYIIVHADPVKIPVKEVLKPVINSVLFPRNKDSYSAVYTGEQIRPVMVVAYTYMDGSRQRTQRLKLNVDYIVIYENNVNVTDETHTAKVTVKGIGEYAGVITKEFSITPKSIKKVTLSAVGDILFEGDPVVTVMDGTYELVKGEDYEIVLSTSGSSETDTQSELKVRGIGNYTDTSNKKVKFNILKSAAADSTEIKSMAADSVTVEFKKLPAKGYTYNGKAVKPAVVVKDGDAKVPASNYKVIYTNNINAGTQTAIVKVVGVTKKGKGYYGVSKELKFDIQQKDFAKVSVSSIAAVPKTPDFDGVTMTVKDGKRILTEGEDYTVDYSSILNADGKLKDDIVIGQKYEVILKPVSGKNYVAASQKKVYVKFGQLNLASKTANISVTIKDASKNEVEVMYNGVLLTKDTDYTAQVKPDRKKTTYTVTIKAVKKSAYKGTKVVKNLTAPTTSEQQ